MTEEELEEMRKESIRRLRERTREYFERGYHFQCGYGRLNKEPIPEDAEFTYISPNGRLTIKGKHKDEDWVLKNLDQLELVAKDRIIFLEIKDE